MDNSGRAIRANGLSADGAGDDAGPPDEGLVDVGRGGLFAEGHAHGRGGARFADHRPQHRGRLGRAGRARGAAGDGDAFEIEGRLGSDGKEAP